MMLFYVAMGLGVTVFMFVIMCAESVGYNRLERIGFIIAAIGFAGMGLLAFYAMYHKLPSNSTMEQFTQYLDLMRLQALALMSMCWLSYAGVALIFVGAAQQTWRNRKKIFAFAYPVE